MAIVLMRYLVKIGLKIVGTATSHSPWHEARPTLGALRRLRCHAGPQLRDSGGDSNAATARCGRGRDEHSEARIQRGLGLSSDVLG